MSGGVLSCHRNVDLFDRATHDRLNALHGSYKHVKNAVCRTTIFIRNVYESTILNDWGGGPPFFLFSV